LHTCTRLMMLLRRCSQLPLLYYQATGNKASSTILSLFIVITHRHDVDPGESHGPLLAMKVPRYSHFKFKVNISFPNGSLELARQRNGFSLLFRHPLRSPIPSFDRRHFQHHLRRNHIPTYHLCLPSRRLNLGRFEWFVNVFSVHVVWISFIYLVFSDVPVDNMSIPPPGPVFFRS